MNKTKTRMIFRIEYVSFNFKILLILKIVQDILEQRNNDRSSIRSGSLKYDFNKIKEIRRLSSKKDINNPFKINSFQDIKKDIRIPKIIFSI